MPIKKISISLCVFCIAMLFFSGCEQSAGEDESEVIPASSDTSLRVLSLSPGTLDPEFSAAETEYSALVASGDVSVTVTAEPASDKAQVTGVGNKSLNLGNNDFEITVTAENGEQKIYTLTVTREVTGDKDIATAAEFAKIGIDPDYPLSGNYRLTADLTLTDWTPVGNGVWQGNDTPLKRTSTPFSGVFDGNNHAITIQSFARTAVAPNKHYIGIFSAVKGTGTKKAVVKNLKIVSSVSEGSLAPEQSHAVGLVAGYTEQAEISGITLSGALTLTSVTKNIYAGGAVGFAQKGTVIQDCSSNMNVTLTGGKNGGLVKTSFYNFTGGFVGIFKDGVDITRCAMTGNVAGYGSFNASQMFAGGIAGGSYYGFTNVSQGTISYCSNTGNVHGEVGGFWAWTGGIAGVVCGDGDGTFEQTTKVYRSWASGTVTAVSAVTAESSGGYTGNWPYCGGIAGYIYQGGMVAECYFTGTVQSRAQNPGDTVYDYTGGIAGYISRNPGHTSVIRDCWSSGTVNGYVNGGGIVGQMQFYTYLWNCYSRAEINVTSPAGAAGNMSQQGVGGITGFNGSGETGGIKRPGKKAISSCVALNPSITAPSGFGRLGRVIGDNATGVLENTAVGGQYQDVYGWSDMPVLVDGAPSAYENRVDGTDCAAQPNQAFYEGIGWDFAQIWKMGAGGYPRLQWEP